jgi:hypothetical protein
MSFTWGETPEMFPHKHNVRNRDLVPGKARRQTDKKTNANEVDKDTHIRYNV